MTEDLLVAVPFVVTTTVSVFCSFSAVSTDVSMSEYVQICSNNVKVIFCTYVIFDSYRHNFPDSDVLQFTFSLYNFCCLKEDNL